MSVDPLLTEAISTFRAKLDGISDLPIREPAAMLLATVDEQGRPSARTVLLRSFDERGFVFFTNSLSRKGRQMADNPYVALCMYWDAWAEQFHVEGRIEKIADEETDAYWIRRPRSSRIGAWASDQSDPLDSRETLLARFEEFERRYEGQQDIPRPDHWYGYRVVPERIEFWCGRDARLHERIIYELTDGGWSKGMLYP